MRTEALLVVFFSFLSSSLAETINYVLIYRTRSYKDLKVAIQKTQSKLDRQRSIVVDVEREKKIKRKEGMLKETLDDQNFRMTFVKFKSMIAVGVVLFVIMRILSSNFSGIVVARLPFEPMNFVGRISHRGLTGDDMRDCSFYFLYFLASMTFRQNIQKFFGFEPPKTPSVFQSMENKSA